MLNRTTFAALSFASISLLSLAAHADEAADAVAPLATPAEAAPAPAAIERTQAQATDDEQVPGPDTTTTAQAAPAPAPAYAPAYQQQPTFTPVTQVARPFPDREGFTIGFALGAGNLKIGETDVDPESNVGFSLRLGGAITPSFLIQADVEATRADFGKDGALQLNFFGVSATGYLHPRVYLVGGLGAASLSAVDKDNDVTDRTDNALGVLLGIGVEAYQSSGFGLSIELRGVAASFDDIIINGESTTVTGGNILLGFQWF
jgi:hypothetical protein